MTCSSLLQTSCQVSTVDREIFTVKTIRVLNFHVKNILPPNGSYFIFVRLILPPNGSYFIFVHLILPPKQLAKKF